MLLRARSFTLDGEAVVCGPDGVAIFDALHRRGTVTEAMLYAFDLLELDGEDLRGLPLIDRKKRLARLLGGRRLGIVLSDHTDQDGITIFLQACKMGLEGIVSKRLSAPYRSGRSTEWLLLELSKVTENMLRQPGALAIWLHTSRAALFPQVRYLAKEMWRELERGFPLLSDVLLHIEGNFGLHLDVRGAQRFPVGLDPHGT
jgi:hypothetical protein